MKKIFNVLIYATLQYLFSFAIGKDKMPIPFRADNFCHFGLVGLLGLGVGVKTSLVILHGGEIGA